MFISIRWWRDAEYSPNGGVTVVSSTIERGTAVLNLVGTVKPDREMVRGVATYLWDKDMAIDASAKLANGQATDLLADCGSAGEGSGDGDGEPGSEWERDDS